MLTFLLSFILCFTAISSQNSNFPSSPSSPGQSGPLAAEDIPISERQFRVVYEWRTIDFAYKTDEERDKARQIGHFIDENVLISDVKAFANRLYLTMPRMLNGVPATLGWIIAPDNNGRSDPLVEPFPSWEMNEEGNCSALQFVQGIAIDANGIMWVVDSGRSRTLRQQDRPISCIPKLMLFDLKRNGSLVLKYEFPGDVARRDINYLNKIVVDDAFGGYAYITDNSGSDPGIVVYSKRLNKSWKVREDNSMRASLNAMDFAVNGTSLRFSIHIDGIALGPYYNPNTGDSSSSPSTVYNPNLINDNYERNVYYSPLSSYHLYSIPASILRDPEFTKRARARELQNVIVDYGLKASQTDGMIMDNRGILYYGLLKEHAIAQWDSFQPFTPNNQHIIAKDDDFIQWIDGMTFDEYGYLYVVINRLHNFVARRLKSNEINYRILRAKTGTMSYVYTKIPAPGNVGISLLPEFSDNGISSTSPMYHSYESEYQNNLATKMIFLNFIQIFIASIIFIYLH